MSISLEIPKFHGNSKSLLTDLLNFSMDGRSTFTPTSASARESETKIGGDFHAVFRHNQDTAILTQRGIDGRPFDTIVVRFNSAVNNKATVYLTVTFKNVFISGIQFSNGDADGSVLGISCNYGEKTVEFAK